MPAEVDGSVAEILVTAGPHAHVQASVAEVLWGTAGVVPTQAADIHTQVAEVLVTPADRGHVEAQVAEILWQDLTGRSEIEASVAEVLWGTPGVLRTQEAQEYASVAEVLVTASNRGHVEASVAELLVRYERAVADVRNIVGPSVTPATFDGSTSLGAIFQYRWSWVSVPPGSAIANTTVPYPDGGLPLPIDMTADAVLYHADEPAGIVGIDTSGLGNNAALSAITVAQPGNVGPFSWGYTLASSVARIGAAVSLAGDWTIAFWFFGLAPNTAWRTGIEGQSNHHPIIIENGGDELGVYADGAGGFTGCGFLMPVAEYAGWHHIAAVGSGTETRFFVDGVLVGTSPFKPSDPDGAWAIGNANAGSQRFADRLDEIAIWTRALSSIEVADIFVLQKGTFAGVGTTHTFTPDLDGYYTINLQVVSASTGGLNNDLGTARIGISPGLLLFPLQGDAIRQWSHLQGALLRRRGETK